LGDEHDREDEWFSRDEDEFHVAGTDHVAEKEADEIIGSIAISAHLGSSSSPPVPPPAALTAEKLEYFLSPPLPILLHLLLTPSSVAFFFPFSLSSGLFCPIFRRRDELFPEILQELEAKKRKRDLEDEDNFFDSLVNPKKKPRHEAD